MTTIVETLQVGDFNTFVDLLTPCFFFFFFFIKYNYIVDTLHVEDSDTLLIC